MEKDEEFAGKYVKKKGEMEGNNEIKERNEFYIFSIICAISFNVELELLEHSPQKVIPGETHERDFLPALRDIILEILKIKKMSFISVLLLFY